jgi:hypothetical protein
VANTGLTDTGVPLAAVAKTLGFAQCKQGFKEFEKPKTGMGFGRDFPGKSIARKGHVVKRVLEQNLYKSAGAGENVGQGWRHFAEGAAIPAAAGKLRQGDTEDGEKEKERKKLHRVHRGKNTEDTESRETRRWLGE